MEMTAREVENNVVNQLIEEEHTTLNVKALTAYKLCNHYWDRIKIAELFKIDFQV